jgi:TatD DNase family protein
MESQKDQMSALSYLDIHTHLRISNPENVVVSSLSMEEISHKTLIGSYSCAGIHPWWLEEISQEVVDHLKANIIDLASKGKLWGVGETGLDRLYPEFFDQQKKLFLWHLDLSESLGLPLIIHNVRAGSDFLEIIKEKKPTVPWLFHDFRGNEELVKNLLRLHESCYFSFGISIDNSPQIRELLPQVPLENLFLETDNQKHLDIHEIYLRAAEQLHLDLDFLKSQLWLNFKKINRQIQ